MKLSDLEHIRLVREDFKVLVTKEQADTIFDDFPSKEAQEFSDSYTDSSNCIIAKALKRILGVVSVTVYPYSVEVGEVDRGIENGNYSSLARASESFLNGAEHFDIRFQ